MRNNNLQIETRLRDKGYQVIAGVDEVGRGPLAGPVYACAAAFDASFYHEEVRDSKKLSWQKRQKLAGIIRAGALSLGIGIASVAEIEEINIRQATFLAMRRALAELTVRPDFLLIDGEILPESPYPAKGIIHGDDVSFTIGAASIIAKVARDQYMQELDSDYPEYRFANNKGYGTAEHISAIRMYGPTPHHRRSFLGKILA